MRYSALIGILALPLLVMAQDKIKLEPKWEKGAKAKHSFAYTFVLPDNEAKVSGSYTAEVQAAQKLKYTFEGVSVVVDGNPLTDYTAEASDVIFEKSGALKTITGGIEGGDTARIYLSGTFIAPDKELAKDEVWKLAIPKNTELELGEMSYEAKYLGPDKIGEASAHKFSTTLKETGNGFSVENTLWVDASGKILKLEGKFKQMPVPAVQASADGTIKIDLAK